METLKQLFARVMDIDSKQVNDDSSPENIESWDSFNGLMLVSELEKNFEVKFSMDEVMSVTKYNDIRDFLRKHGVKEGLD